MRWRPDGRGRAMFRSQQTRRRSLRRCQRGNGGAMEMSAMARDGGGSLALVRPVRRFQPWAANGLASRRSQRRKVLKVDFCRRRLALLLQKSDFDFSERASPRW
jgi:hypothetical protein